MLVEDGFQPFYYPCGAHHIKKKGDVMKNFTNEATMKNKSFTLSFHGNDVAVSHSVKTGLYVPDGIMGNFYKRHGLAPATLDEYKAARAVIIEDLKKEVEALGLKILGKTNSSKAFSFWVELPQKWGFKCLRVGNSAEFSSYEISSHDGWEMI